jgi:hypothetical protein
MKKLTIHTLNDLDIENIETVIKHVARQISEGFNEGIGHPIDWRLQEEIKPKTTYYLFGYDAINELRYNDIKGVLNKYSQDNSDFETFAFEEGITSSKDFIQAFQNWSEYAIISRDSYNELNLIAQ